MELRPLSFITTQFNFEKRFIDIDIQGDFDGSVNIIFTDDKITQE
jgi:hypothetical protein